MKRFDRVLVLLALAGVLAACGGTPAASVTPTVPPSEPTATTAAAAPTEAAPTTAPTTEAPTTEAATAAPPAESTPTAPAATTTTAAGGADLSDADLKAALQKTVDIWSQAHTDADTKLLLSAMDPKALALRRTMSQLLKFYTNGGS